MSKLIIHGGKKLHGAVTTNSSKNAAMGILASIPLFSGTVVLDDLPLIEEVKRMLEVLSSIGVRVTWLAKRKVALQVGAISLRGLNREAFVKMRSGIMLISSLANHFKTFQLPRSGGCKLGKRTVNPHIYALDDLGVHVAVVKGAYRVTVGKRRGRQVVMYESGDTAIENTIIAAVLTPGKTTIQFSTGNYMVRELCYFLREAGAKIKGIETTTLEIEGVKRLRPVKRYSIMPDPIESMALIAIAVTTRSPLTVKACPIDFLLLELEKLRRMGQRFTVKNRRRSKSGYFTLVDITFTPSYLVAPSDKLDARPFPGINIDNLPFFVPIVTQARGKTLIHDWVYENRAVYYLELQKLGAKMTLYDPHRIEIEGPTVLQANEIICPPALRPAANLMVAMLAARGISILRNTYSIDRGYENLYQRLNALGAQIEVIDE
ncbi:UDP-N-acetylglucosamine 1-carboxyvinyltransferase [Candidatus Falkowbacteria bacterium]|nr:UDP-N-acetylglucosamine 1-carboxyvinyltransferase [Candidatus Falkowbacteria bacterium]